MNDDFPFALRECFSHPAPMRRLDVRPAQACTARWGCFYEHDAADVFMLYVRFEHVGAAWAGSGKSRLVMINDRAMEALDAAPVLPGCPYVFYNPETGRRWSDCRKPWEKAREAAGYPWMTSKHLRPAFATQLSESGLETHFVSE